MRLTKIVFLIFSLNLNSAYAEASATAFNTQIRVCCKVSQAKWGSGIVRSDTRYTSLPERIVADMHPRYALEHPDDEVMSKQSKVSEVLPSKIVDSIREQFEQCWVVPKEFGEISNLIVLLRVELSKGGKVVSVSLSKKERTRYKSDPSFRAVADLAIEAVRKCNIIKGLPADKYEIWKEMELTFDPAGHP